MRCLYSDDGHCSSMSTAACLCPKDIKFVNGDDLWDGAEAGWYIYDHDGDTTGPFSTEEEARKSAEED